MFERELAARGDSGFFSGRGQPGWLDYMVWPWFERMDIFAAIYQVAAKLTMVVCNLVSRSPPSPSPARSCAAWPPGWRGCCRSPRWPPTASTPPPTRSSWPR